jgi:hypothetical protein
MVLYPFNGKIAAGVLSTFAVAARAIFAHLSFPIL